MSTPIERVATLELADFYEEGEQLPAQPCCEHRCNMAPRAAYCNSGHPLSARVPPISYVEEFLRAGGVLAQLVRALRRFEFHTKKTDDGEKTITFTPTFICKYIERKLHFGETPQNTIAVQRIMHLAGGSGPKDRLEYADVIGDRVFQKLLKDIYDVYDMGHTKDDAENEVITEVANFMRSYLDEHSPIYTVRRENLRGSKLRIVFKENAAGEKEVIFPITMHDAEIFRRCFPGGLPSELHGRTLGDGHFSSCPGVVTPPSLSALRGALCDGVAALRTTLRRVTAMSFYRARIEHRFGRSGSRLAELYRPWSRPGGTALADIIRTVFILIEIRQRVSYGDGSSYKAGDADRCEDAMETNTLALSRYGDALKKFASDPHPHCKCLAARRAQRRSVARRDTRPAVAHNPVAVSNRRRALLASALAARRRSQNQFRRLLGREDNSEETSDDA